MAARKTKSKRSKPEEPAFVKPEIWEEVLVILIMGLGVLTLFSVYTGKMGIAGNLWGSFLKGSFGIGAYILPFSVLVYCVWKLMKRPAKKQMIFRLTMDCVLLLLLVTFFHIFFVAQTEREQYKNLLTYAFSIYAGGSWTNGGFLGALFGEFLYKLLGPYGSYIILLLGIVVAFMMSTSVSLIQYVEKGYRNVKPWVKKNTPRKVKRLKADLDKEGEDNEDDIAIKIHGDIEMTAKEDGFGGEEIQIPTFLLEDEAETKEEETEAQIFDYASQEKEKPEAEQIAQKMDLPKAVVETERVIEAAMFSKDSYIHYEFPPIDLLKPNHTEGNTESKKEMLKNAKKLESTLSSFGVEAKVLQINRGPTVTRYEMSPSVGVKVSKIVGLSDDLALNLAAQDIRIEAPIPGKAAVGIEVPNREAQPVFLREVIESDEFQKFPSKLAFALGKDIGGSPIVADIAKMPHLLIAGATGSGKSVCINTLITSILYKANPNEVKLLMVDPKVVELKMYSGIPHLLIPVVTDPQKAAGALNWAVTEMLNRYKLFADRNVRDLAGYNRSLNEEDELSPLPQIVIIIDELMDLMMAAPKEVEDSICRLAQMARAAGIHLIIATQRPSVDVITGVIKANVPSRLAFSVSSGIDSRTILDMVGAERLLGKGDMLFYPMGFSKPLRVQGAFVSTKEVEEIVEFVKQSHPTSYDENMIEEITSSRKVAEVSESSDEHLIDAIGFVVEKEKASASMLQRQFRIGYNRAANLIEDMEKRGIVGPEDGSKPRKVLMGKLEWEEYKDSLLQSK